MITEGTLNLMTKIGEYNGVVGFWYQDTLRFLFIMGILLIAGIFMVIGIFTVLKWIFFGIPKKKKY